jgi:hypothetical protein
MLTRGTGRLVVDPPVVLPSPSSDLGNTDNRGGQKVARRRRDSATGTHVVTHRDAVLLGDFLG